MSLHFGSGEIANVYLGSTKLDSVHVGTEKVWPTSKPILLTNMLVHLSTDPESFSGGRVWSDLSGHNNHAEMFGSPQFSSTSGFTFDGANDYFAVTAVPRHNLSLECWFKTTQSGGYYSRSNWYDGLSLIDGETPHVGDDYGLNILMGHPVFGAGPVTVRAPAPCNDGKWHQAVGIRNRDTEDMKLYVDGALVASGTAVGTSMGAPKLFIGMNEVAAPTLSAFRGSIAAVHIYEILLSEAQVHANFLAMQSRLR